MNYRQAEQYLISFTDYEKTPGIAYTAANYDLRRMEALLQPLGNPHLGTKTVHIAGTKGKGSTAAMITQALTTAGYKTGLFTSPHLHTIRERIRINGIPITSADFASAVTKLQPVVEVLNKELTYGPLTTFEILTAAVFVHFKRGNIDFQVLEVGLGGRLDATNVAKGDVCIITSISFDHTEILGDSLAKIAIEKAGIIKPGCVVVSALQPTEADKVIEDTCVRQNVRLIQVGKDVTWRRIDGDLNHQSLVVNTKARQYELTIPLIGNHQLENTATAVAALEVLAQLGAKISPQAIEQGLSQVNWPGRLQILRHRPMVVVDGAHNAYSMQKLVETIKESFKYAKCFVIFGTSCDKDIAGMAQELRALNAYQISLTSSSHPRAASAATLAEKFARQGIEVKIIRDVPEALTEPLALATSRDLILITGSLFVVAEAIGYFKRKRKALLGKTN